MKLLISATALLLMTGTAVAESWVDKVNLKSDFRFRHEYIETKGSTVRQRQRFRARLGVNYKVSETIKAGLQFASGSTDPVSTNQSLDGGFSTKTVGIDLAYVKWQAMDELSLTAGKQKNPYYRPGKAELIWDGDLNFEGISMAYDRSLGPVDMDLALGSFWVDELSSTSEDILLTGAQLGVGTKVMDDKLSVKVGAGVYEYSHIIGTATVFDTTDSFGNSTTNSLYATPFHLTQIYAEVGLKMLPIPVSIFFDSVTNNSAAADNKGTLYGIKIGKTKAPGSWDFRFNFREIEKDAVLGAFTDSDFKGGGTDGKGSEFGAGYQLNKKTKVGLTFFVNETSLTAANSKDFYRGQLDFVFKL